MQYTNRVVEVIMLYAVCTALSLSVLAFRYEYRHDYQIFFHEESILLQSGSAQRLMPPEEL